MVVLPSYPRAYSQDDLIIIEDKEGIRYVWGNEKNSEKAEIVAEQIDIELRLYAYIQETADTFLSSIFDSITSIADDAVILEFMHDALYQWIRKHKQGYFSH